MTSSRSRAPRYTSRDWPRGRAQGPCMAQLAQPAQPVQLAASWRAEASLGRWREKQLYHFTTVSGEPLNCCGNKHNADPHIFEETYPKYLFAGAQKVRTIQKNASIIRPTNHRLKTKASRTIPSFKNKGHPQSYL